MLAAYFRRGTQAGNSVVVANALAAADSAVASQLGMLNTVFNGSSWSQYYGQFPYAGGWGASNPSDAYYAASGYVSTDPIVAAVLGYDSSSAYNFGTQFLMQYNSLYSPWAGYGGYGYFGARAKQQEGEDTAPIEAEFQELGRLQEITYYTDETLSELRAEAYAVMLTLMYGDPLYLYWDYWLDYNVQQIYTSRPSYPTLYDLAVAIDSWTSPPDDLQTLAERYYYRLLYFYYASVVEYEVWVYLATYPDVAAWIDEVSTWLSNQLLLNWESAEVQAWYADWSNRWQDAYIHAMGSAEPVEKIEEILDEYPLYQEYMDLNAEVVALLPSFNEHPAVQDLAAQTGDVLTDQTVRDWVNQYYQSYTDQVNTLLSSTTFVAELERYYERLNGLAKADTTFQELETQVLAALQQFQVDVATAVDACYANYGDSCDPYQDPNVVALYDQDAIDLLTVAGLFTELQPIYWYAFYTGDEYLALEAETLAKLEASLAPVESDLATARASFMQNVQDIPDIQSLQENRSNLISTLRTGSTGRSGDQSLAAWAEASETLDQHLTRMADLAVVLESTTPTADAGGPYAVDEGTSVSLHGSGMAPSGAAGATLTYAWDLDNDGVFETNGRTPTLNASQLDGPSTVTVVLRVIDPDGNVATDTATVTVKNVPPTARDDTGVTEANAPVTINVLANDSDVPGDPLQISSVTQGSHGTVTVNGGKSVTYTPKPDFAGQDSFTYTVSDGDGGASTATVDVEVQGGSGGTGDERQLFLPALLK